MENHCNYPKDFIELVEKVNDSESEVYGQYIGVGNPNAKILIIGKESAINTKNDDEKQQYEIEYLRNATGWLQNINNNVAFLDADKDELWKNGCNASINPMYPYRGQRFTIYRKKCDGTEIGCGGTSSTWYNYQKIINNMRSISLDDKRKRTICFHEYCFSTELSSVSAKYSKEADPKKRKESIKARTAELLKLPFYQQFPIVIVAAGHYPKIFGIDLEKLFGVKWDGKTIDRNDKCKLKRNWLNVHFGNQPKLLIHTNQLSINITDVLLRLIAEKCDEFVKSNNIKL